VSFHDTRLAALQSVQSEAANLRRLCLEALDEHGPSTADEIAYNLSRSVLSVRPRFTELLKTRRIEPTGEVRMNDSGRFAKVWRMADEPKVPR
jgi:predicted ArsR family transcriptional regulator